MIRSLGDGFTCPVCGATADGPVSRALPGPVYCENHVAHPVDDLGVQLVYPLVPMTPLPDEVAGFMAGLADASGKRPRPKLASKSGKRKKGT